MRRGTIRAILEILNFPFLSSGKTQPGIGKGQTDFPIALFPEAG